MLLIPISKTNMLIDERTVPHAIPIVSSRGAARRDLVPVVKGRFVKQEITWRQ